MQNEIHVNDHTTHMITRVTKIQINKCVLSQIPSFSRYECVCVCIYHNYKYVYTCICIKKKQCIFMRVSMGWVQHDKETYMNIYQWIYHTIILYARIWAQNLNDSVACMKESCNTHACDNHKRVIPYIWMHTWTIMAHKWKHHENTYEWMFHATNPVSLNILVHAYT